MDYLRDACGPRPGPGKARETLYDWQRPPLRLRLRSGWKLRCPWTASLRPSHYSSRRTRATSSVVSVEAGGEALVDALSSCGVDARVEASFEADAALTSSPVLI